MGAGAGGCAASSCAPGSLVVMSVAVAVNCEGARGGGAQDGVHAVVGLRLRCTWLWGSGRGARGCGAQVEVHVVVGLRMGCTWWWGSGWGEQGSCQPPCNHACASCCCSTATVQALLGQQACKHFLNSKRAGVLYEQQACCAS
eukprot:191165-Chlamydomonas_euryale.AAC.1